MKKLLLFIYIILIIPQIKAQQYPIISNYLTTQYGFNPATTGTISNSHFHLFYRTQWVGFEEAPQTQFASYRKKIGGSPLTLGAYVFNEEAGSIVRNGGTALASYTRQLDETVFLSIGLAAGYHNLRLRNDFRIKDLSDIVAADAQTGVWYPDLNAGIHIRLRDFYVGFSVPQIMNTKLQFGDSNTINRLQRHYYIISGYKIPVSDHLTVEPSTLVKIAAGSNPQIEASLRMYFYDKFWLGTSYRAEDAIVAMTGFRLGKNLSLAYAYDLTTSDLRAVSSGSHEISLGIRWGGVPDSDEDGIPDNKDKCPDQPGPADTEGCPEDIFALFAKKDADGDGVVNDLDGCPNKKGPKDNHGCPWPDRDNDGVTDNIDRCPDLAGVAENEGCLENDSDRDGIIDDLDKCPEEPGSYITQGCPDTDSDKDGLRDQFDECPYTFGPPSNGGCPIVTTEEKDLLNEVKRDLNFKTGEAEIWPESKQQLVKLANLLSERADWQLRIAGHTDNKGSAKTNLKVSRERAEAVRDFLVGQGIPSAQIVVEYFGETKPLTSNDTDLGRLINRRVELEFIFD